MTTAVSSFVRLRLPALAVYVCLAVASAVAQNPLDLARITAQDLARRAAIIFSGTVVAVKHVPAAAPDGVATVRVTFRVGEAVRGVAAGQMLTISEWQGLWQSGERYRVGQKVVLFLHAPSGELGLTSPVGGDAGRLVVDRQGMVELAAADTATLAPGTANASGPKAAVPRHRKIRINRKELMEAIRRGELD